MRPVKTIRDSYKTNTFMVEGKGKLLLASPDFKVIEQTAHHDIFRATVQILDNQSPNVLLKYMLDRVEIHSFREKIPSINEIFIQTVTEKEHA